MFLRCRLQESDRPRVVIIGAGLAGLCAGYELSKAGCPVRILEARTRPGGRVLTLREPFTRGLHAEAGAMYTSDTAANLMRYVSLFKIDLTPVTLIGDRKTVFHISGKRNVVAPGGRIAWPPGLTQEEKTLGPSGMWNNYITSFVQAIGLPQSWPSDLLQNLEKMTFADFLRGRGASEDAISVLRAGYLDSYGEGIDAIGALQFLNAFAADQYRKSAFVIGGGSDRLVEAFVQSFSGKIIYDAAVTRVDQKPDRIVITVSNGNQQNQFEADYVICSVPATTARDIQFQPSLSETKRKAMEELSYTSVTRIYLQEKERFWTKEGVGGDAATDLPVMRVIEHPIGKEGRSGILEAFTTGETARELGAQGNEDRCRLALSQMAKVHPGTIQHYERGFSFCWDQEPWSKGAFSWFRPGQFSSLIPILRSAEGRIHFAGEHTSSYPATMEGALESGRRAAQEILDRSR